MSSNHCTIEDQRSKSEFTFREDVAPGYTTIMSLEKIYHSTTSKFQKIDVIQSYFGKHLVTDGKTQSAELDEFAYHESLVHPSLFQSASLAAKNSAEKKEEPDVTHLDTPQSVFIGGGGELATAREALRHKSVKRVVMVDIDGEVVECCKKYLPEWGGEDVTNNPRFELVIGDAYEYLLNCSEKFDVIILDISDPIEAGPGIMLYTKEFYDHAKTLLTDNGVFVTQAGTADTVPSPTVAGGLSDSIGPIASTLKSVFDCIVPYTINIPSFGGDWGFVMAFDSLNSREAVLDAMSRPIIEIDRMISLRIGDFKDIENSDKDGHDYLRHYDGMTHRRMCFLPKSLRAILTNDTRVITKENPIFMY